MERVCLTKRIGFVVFFIGVARLTWALSDVFNLPAEDGCVGESIFISEDSFGERGQRRTSREVIKPPPQQYLRYGMTEAEVQKSLSDDAYCSDYRAVFPNEAAAILHVIKVYLPSLQDDNVRAVVYRATQSKDGQTASSPILIGLFHKQLGLLDAFWVRNGADSPLITAFGKGRFEDTFLSIAVGEVLDSVFRKLGVRSPTSYEQDSVGVWCVRYVYDIANCPAIIWVDGATATVRKVELSGAHWRTGRQRPIKESLDTSAMREIVEYGCALFEEREGKSTVGSISDEIEALSRRSRQLHLRLLLCSDDEMAATLCKQRVQVLQRLVALLGKRDLDSYTDMLRVALMDEHLKRFQCEYAHLLFAYFPGEAVERSPYLLGHQRAAVRCVRLAKQAYDRGLIDDNRFYRILLLLEPPCPRLPKEGCLQVKSGRN